VKKTKHNNDDGDDDKTRKLKRKWIKKLREIERIEGCMANGMELQKDQKMKLETKTTVLKELKELETTLLAGSSDNVGEREKPNNQQQQQQQQDASMVVVEKDNETTTIMKLKLAKEYLDLVDLYPTTIRTIVFHTRRILKHLLDEYQLMEECVACTDVYAVRDIIKRIERYRVDPNQFQFDAAKARADKVALEARKREEGKRKAFEARMMRKAKRQGHELEYYLRMGADVPTVAFLQTLQTIKDPVEQLDTWKRHNHAQHCLSYHLQQQAQGAGGGSSSSNTCPRGRSCAFLHVPPRGENSFVEEDEVAG